MPLFVGFPSSLRPSRLNQSSPFTSSIFHRNDARRFVLAEVEVERRQLSGVVSVVLANLEVGTEGADGHGAAGVVQRITRAEEQDASLVAMVTVAVVLSPDRV